MKGVLCAQQHRFTYNEAMPVESCTQALSDLALRFGEDDDEEGGMVRFHPWSSSFSLLCKFARCAAPVR